MPTSRRIALRLDERRVKVAQMYLDGKSQAEIATAFGLTQQQISLDLKAVRVLWQQRAAGIFSQHQAELLARIDGTERKFNDAWERSLTEQTAVTTEGTQGQGSPKARVTRRQRDGNPAFLNGVLECIRERAKVLGLYAPVKIAATDPSGDTPYDDISPSERLARAIAILESVPAARIDGPVDRESIEGVFTELPPPPGEVRP